MCQDRNNDQTDAMEHCKDLDSILAHANNEKERNAIFEFILQQSLKGGYHFSAKLGSIKRYF